MNTLDNDAAAGFPDCDLGGGFCRAGLLTVRQDHLVRDLLLKVLLPLLVHLVHDLAFSDAAVSDGGEDRIPVLHRVSAQNLFLIFRLVQGAPVEALALAVVQDQFFSADDVFFLKLALEPLVDLVLGLTALDDLQPVAAGAPGVLGRDDLNTVAALDLVVDIDQLPVDSGADHPVAHRRVDGVGKIHRGGAHREGLHIACRREGID